MRGMVDMRVVVETYQVLDERYGGHEGEDRTHECCICIGFVSIHIKYTRLSTHKQKGRQRQHERNGQERKT